LIAVGVRAADVGQQAPATADHFEQSTPGMMVVDVGLEVLVQVIYPSREDRYLYFGGAGVPFVGVILGDDFRLIYCGQILSLLSFYALFSSLTREL
jgi:hypothetical protein